MARTPARTPPGDRDKACSFAEIAARWTLLTAFVTVPIAVAPGVTFDVFNVPKLGLLIIGVSLALALHVFQVLRGCAPPIPRAALVVSAALLLPLLLSWLLSPYREWALFGQYSRFQGLLPYGAFALLGVLTATAFRGRPRPLAWALAASGGLVATGLLAGMMGLTPAEIAGQAGTLGNGNYVGGYLAIALPVSLHLWLTEPGRSYGAMATTALIAAGLILSFSQGGQLAAVAGATVVLGFHSRRAWARPLALFVALSIALAAIGVVAVNLFTPVGGFTAMTRSNMWRTAAAMGAQSPVVGSGPNTFAIEAPRFRSLEDSVTLGGQVGGFAPIGIEYQTSDDPHSVPLSFFANGGALGLTGILLAWGWLLWSGLRRRARDPLAAAFLAAVVAYMVQALVSVDEVTLRLGFWVAQAGLLVAILPSGSDREDAPPPARWRSSVATAVAVAVAAAGSYYGARFILADVQARSAQAHFEVERVDQGAAALGSALSFRDEAAYRELLAGRLGLAALEAGAGGEPLIGRMRRLNGYLDELPDVGALHAYARIMSYWSHYEESARTEALALFQRVARLDPVNPLIKVETAEVLVDLDRTSEALAILEPVRSVLSGRVPEYWGALSMTRLAAGDKAGAAEALSEATQIAPGDCRTRLARTLLALASTTGPPAKPDDPLSLIVSCDPGLYDMFLRRLPPRHLDKYS